MPYASTAELPETVQKLPKTAQDIWRAAFNASYPKLGEKAAAVAWAAVEKQGYKGFQKSGLQPDGGYVIDDSFSDIKAIFDNLKPKQPEVKMYAVKFYDEEKGIIEGLGIPYGGPLRTDVKDLGKDLQAEFFSDKTNFKSAWYDGKSVKSMPELYHHGFDEELKDAPIGEVIDVQDTPQGKWVKVQLDKANKYYESIKRLVKAGKLLFSSGAVPEGVKKAPDGFIEAWPWKEMSLTPSPANPLAMTSFKALVDDTEAKPEAIAESLGVTPEQMPEFMAGFKQEMEHIDSVNGDLKTIGKIVLDHLKEDPKYYTNAAKFDESEHPRADNGEFGQGSGTAVTDKPKEDKPGKLMATATGEYDRDRNIEILKNHGYEVRVEETPGHMTEGVSGDMRKVPGKVYRLYAYKKEKENTEAKTVKMDTNTNGSVAPATISISESMQKSLLAKKTNELPYVPIKPDPSIPAATQGHVAGETKEAPPECAKKCVVKCTCGKAVVLPQEVINALTALQDSIVTIMEGQGVNDTEKPSEPAADVPQAPSQPGVGQGMAPENHGEAKGRTGTGPDRRP